MSYEEKMRKYDNIIKRGVKEPSPLGTGLFVGLRSLDPFLQYGILAKGVGTGLIEKLGLDVLPQGPPVITNTFIDSLGLSPYRLILLAMATGSAIKQNYWLLAISHEAFPASAAASVSAFNTLFNSLNSFFFICSATSASVNGEYFPQTPLLVGSALYTVGILTETVSEWQRKHFKDDPANKGKVYQGGLFSLARHINYGGYIFWRTGYALAAGGWTWGAFVAAFFSWDFATRGIPVLNSYCADRVGTILKVTRYEMLTLCAVWRTVGALPAADSVQAHPVHILRCQLLAPAFETYLLHVANYQLMTTFPLQCEPPSLLTVVLIYTCRRLCTRRPVDVILVPQQVVSVPVSSRH